MTGDSKTGAIRTALRGRRQRLELRARHPAALDLGDCLSYATAWIAGRPPLCKGDDFRLTDVPLA